jgi:copper(I)-binding protein
MKNIHYIKFFLFFALLLGLITHTHATSLINAEGGYIKASIPGSDITAAYMTLKNTGNKAITLQKITSTISDRIEIHEHSMADGMMRMREVGEVVVKAKGHVVLQPSGLHLMIFALKEPLIEQDLIPLTLTFSNGTKLNIQLPVYRYK